RAGDGESTGLVTWASKSSVGQRGRRVIADHEAVVGGVRSGHGERVIPARNRGSRIRQAGGPRPRQALVADVARCGNTRLRAKSLPVKSVTTIVWSGIHGGGRASNISCAGQGI